MPPQMRQRVPPLPDLQWTEVEDLWNSMRSKDYSYLRDPELMSHHPALKPHMRAILIDWLIEVRNESWGIPGGGTTPGHWVTVELSFFHLDFEGCMLNIKRR